MGLVTDWWFISRWQLIQFLDAAWRGMLAALVQLHLHGLVIREFEAEVMPKLQPNHAHGRQAALQVS